MVSFPVALERITATVRPVETVNQGRAHVPFQGASHSRSSRGKIDTVSLSNRRSRINVTSGISAPPPAPAPAGNWREKEAARQKDKEQSKALDDANVARYRQQRAAGRQTDLPAEVKKSLDELKAHPYIEEDGKVVDLSEDGVKASVYAIFDEDLNVQYIGMSRGIHASMRLHLVRRPQLCHHVKVLHLTQPSRAHLAAIQDHWIECLGEKPPGNDGGEEQNLWENPLDVKLHMTAEDAATVAAAEQGKAKEKALKVVTRKFEAVIMEEIKARGITERFRFEPKAKSKGLLDLKATVTSNAPPTSKPGPKK